MEKSKPQSKYTQSNSKEWIINKNSDKAWSCYQQWQEFCWLLWGQGLPLMTPDNVKRKGSWELFLHFTVLGMLYIPFLHWVAWKRIMFSAKNCPRVCLETISDLWINDYVQIVHWYLQSLSPLVSTMCRIFRFFSAEKELNWQLYIWFVPDKNLLEFATWLLSFGTLRACISHCIKD